MTMPKKTKSKSSRVKIRRNPNAVRSSKRQRAVDRRELPKEIDTVQTLVARRVEAGANRAITELRRATDASVPHETAKNPGEGLLRTAASVTGAVLAIGSMAVLAPVTVGLQLLDARRPVRAAAKVLRSTDRSVGGSRQGENSDLKRREYRDEAGEVHHHTHTYMLDHAGKGRAAA